MKGLIDSDRHVIEPISIWEQYVDASIYAAYPVSLVLDTPENRQERINRLGPWGDVALPPIMTIGGMPILKDWDENNQIASAHDNSSSFELRAQAMQGDTQVANMDESGFEYATLYSTFAGFIVNHAQVPAKVSLAYADAYNRWLNDYAQAAPSRLAPIGLISRHDPSTMCSQLQSIIDLGWSTVTVRPEVIRGRHLGHDDYLPFWEMCQRNHISVSIHGSSNLNGNTVGSERFDTRFAQHACSHPMEIQMAFLALLESGVLERFPTLKFGFLEAGASWLPHWLWRLDNICYPEFQSLTKDRITQLPSAYFKRQCWVSVEMGEPCLAEVVKWIGRDKLMFGTDFPHPDHLHLTAESFEQAFPELDSETIQQMLTTNAATFYGLDAVSNSAENAQQETVDV